MGADLIVQFVMLEQGKRPVWRKAKQAIRALAGKQLSQWPEAYLDYRFGGIRVAPEQRNAEIARLEQHLTDLQRAWKEGFRDTVLLEIGSKQLLLTGGPSWGDVPTESYDMFEELIAAGIVEAAGFE